MINRQTITKDQALYAINNGEFGSDVISSKDKVVIIMTQDWCPQWVDMSNWVYDVQTAEEIDVYELIYNKVDYYNEFRAFKENRLHNHEIPYLRFYIGGKLVKETNYVGKQMFSSIIEV